MGLLSRYGQAEAVHVMEVEGRVGVYARYECYGGYKACKRAKLGGVGYVFDV